MTRLLWLFNDKDSEPYLTGSFLPLVREIPGTDGVSLLRVTASGMGEFPARFVVEARFETEDGMNDALATAEGRRVSREIMESAGKGMEVVTLEVMD
ncbi:MAG: hypothetical protein RRA94_15425 [Bacteroidota bacterium]|nr:hypothetical protein [Bacteroidota bacterium]